MAYAGKAFVVTGAASGIGRATVEKLLALQATVHAIDKASPLPEYTNAHHGVVVAHAGIDVGSRSAMACVFDQVAARNESLRGLAHCAGILAETPPSAAGDAALDGLWSVHGLGTWIADTEFHARVQRNSGASIVNIASMASVRGMANLAGYTACKHAVLGFTRALAQEWGPEGLRVNAVAPGAVRTPMIAKLNVQDNAPIPGKQVGVPAYIGTLKHVAEPEEIADSILYLLSDQASNVSGHILESSGAWP
ncbi:hypothetical protein CDD82_4130 [Ophiocordyceps australis]|uniref:NAD-dependent epimerase/dehydratase domain-containing protein n=1 Tax=Ophiocordyceps australis TaxID=1399860 RepID=A0A2C5Z9Q0_9HYPO|nr:hypothetical protein CDD82_4130 [Ophiocordyceps australis]